MSDIAIRAEELGKVYAIGGAATRPDTLRDAWRLMSQAAWHRIKSGPALKQEHWALRHASFDIVQGDVVGIVGANGAGKSTLLKLLSRITKPTEGRAHIHGRIASLLEVGTGFHPELSGRENIFLNGAILGMRKNEIVSKFDDIVEFSGVEKFLDTPVKRYSSGMYVRLAFSVAASLDTDILLIDEVLAVGDSAFQKKCLGKMNDVAQRGRTVVLVSHNMSAVSSLCKTAIWLEQGKIRKIGVSGQIVREYLSSSSAESQTRWRPSGQEAAAFSYKEIFLCHPDGNVVSGEILANCDFYIVFRYQIRQGLPSGRLALRVANEEGITLFASANTDSQSAKHRPWQTGLYEERCRICGNLLVPGRYYISISEPLFEGGDRVHENILSFSISEVNSLAARDGRPGMIAPLLEWACEKSE